jgi:hypothetical protein
MQTKPLEEDCSLKNVAMDAEGAARAQPNQLTPKLKKESQSEHSKHGKPSIPKSVHVHARYDETNGRKAKASKGRQRKEA